MRWTMLTERGSSVQRVKAVRDGAARFRCHTVGRRPSYSREMAFDGHSVTVFEKSSKLPGGLSDLRHGGGASRNRRKWRWMKAEGSEGLGVGIRSRGCDILFNPATAGESRHGHLSGRLRAESRTPSCWPSASAPRRSWAMEGEEAIMLNGLESWQRAGDVAGKHLTWDERASSGSAGGQQAINCATGSAKSVECPAFCGTSVLDEMVYRRSEHEMTCYPHGQSSPGNEGVGLPLA